MEKITMTPNHEAQQKKDNRIQNGFRFLHAALKSRGKQRRFFFTTAAVYFYYAGLYHHSALCGDLGKGKRYYSPIIHP